MKKSEEDYWKAIDLLFPKHQMIGQWNELFKNKDSYCTDDVPNGWGVYGCKRCNAIVGLEKRHIVIWPRNKIQVRRDVKRQRR
jgi:hypothetical protein